MTQAPEFSNLFAISGSSLQYTITLKPSFARISVDFNVSIISGNKFFLSPKTSSFTNFQPPISRANLKVRSASLELNQEIIDKKKVNKIKLKKNDKVEIVHFIGGG